MQRFDNQRLKFFRQFLNLGQDAFAKAIGRTQATISSVEGERSPLSAKMVKTLVDVFHAHPDYFRVGSSSPMFEEGMEDTAITHARRIFQGKKESDPFGEQTEAGLDLDMALAKIEKLEMELSHSREMLESKDDLIMVMKSQLRAWEEQYDRLNKEAAIFREDSERERKSINMEIVQGLSSLRSYMESMGQTAPIVKEMLESKDDLIMVMKSQLREWEERYKSLNKEAAVFREDAEQERRSINMEIVQGLSSLRSYMERMGETAPNVKSGLQNSG